MNARNNKFLVILPTVVLTPIIEPGLIFLDQKFEEANHIAFCTSGLRTELNQLQIIQNYLLKKGLAAKYPEAMTCKVQDQMSYQGKTVYKWQPAWSNLLHINVIINPPKRAICLMESFRGDGSNRLGQWINPSPHFKGTCADIGGGDNGIADEVAIVKPWIGVIPGLVGILPERENNCLHTDWRAV